VGKYLVAMCETCLEPLSECLCTTYLIKGRDRKVKVVKIAPVQTENKGKRRSIDRKRAIKRKYSDAV
jgi:hypothetical protein